MEKNKKTRKVSRQKVLATINQIIMGVVASSSLHSATVDN